MAAQSVQALQQILSGAARATKMGLWVRRVVLPGNLRYVTGLRRGSGSISCGFRAQAFVAFVPECLKGGRNGCGGSCSAGLPSCYGEVQIPLLAGVGGYGFRVRSLFWFCWRGGGGGGVVARRLFKEATHFRCYAACNTYGRCLPGRFRCGDRGVRWRQHIWYAAAHAAYVASRQEKAACPLAQSRLAISGLRSCIRIARSL